MRTRGRPKKEGKTSPINRRSANDAASVFKVSDKSVQHPLYWYRHAAVASESQLTPDTPDFGLLGTRLDPSKRADTRKNGVFFRFLSVTKAALYR
jgi:hypothetical protein